MGYRGSGQSGYLLGTLFDTIFPNPLIHKVVSPRSLLGLHSKQICLTYRARAYPNIQPTLQIVGRDSTDNTQASIPKISHTYLHAAAKEREI